MGYNPLAAARAGPWHRSGPGIPGDCHVHRPDVVLSIFVAIALLSGIGLMVHGLTDNASGATIAGSILASGGLLCATIQSRR